MTFRLYVKSLCPGLDRLREDPWWVRLIRAVMLRLAAGQFEEGGAYPRPGLWYVYPAGGQGGGRLDRYVLVSWRKHPDPSKVLKSKWAWMPGIWYFGKEA